jgi:hypothetical protein
MESVWPSWEAISASRRKRAAGSRLGVDERGALEGLARRGGAQEPAPVPMRNRNRTGFEFITRPPAPYRGPLFLRENLPGEKDPPLRLLGGAVCAVGGPVEGVIQRGERPWWAPESPCPAGAP